MIKINYILDSEHKPSSYLSERFYGCKRIVKFQIKNKINKRFVYHDEEMVLKGDLRLLNDNNPIYISLSKYQQNFNLKNLYFLNSDYCLKHIRRIIREPKIESILIQQLNFLNILLND